MMMFWDRQRYRQADGKKPQKANAQRKGRNIKRLDNLLVPKWRYTERFPPRFVLSIAATETLYPASEIIHHINVVLWRAQKVQARNRSLCEAVPDTSDQE